MCAGPEAIVVEHGHDLIVRFSVIDHQDPSDHARVQDHFTPIDRTLRENADVERIAITFRRQLRDGPDARSAQRARNESIQRRVLRGAPLGTVHAKIAGRLVDLILHEIEGRDLDEGIDDLGGIGTYLQSVPRMGPPAVEGFWEGHRSGQRRPVFKHARRQTSKSPNKSPNHQMLKPTPPR